MIRVINTLVALALSAVSLIGWGQGQSPIQWNFTSEKVSDDEYKIILQADLEEGWHLYTQDPGEGPLPTVYSLESNDNYTLVGGFTESDFITKLEPVFDDQELSFFEKHAEIFQTIKVNGALSEVKGMVTYMVCNDEMCMPPTDQGFLINLTDGSWTDPDVVKLSEIGEVVEEKPEKSMLPAVENVDLGNPVSSCTTGEFDSVENTNSQVQKQEKKEEKKSYWSLLILGFLGGLVSLITPCVFPMIPLTVSFFTKGGQETGKGTGRAILYGLSIVAVYAALSLPFYASGTDPEILNEISTGFWLNIIFFVIFLVFAFSFFGFYELTLPSSWANKADKASDIGGILGIVFMALVLAIVSFSCTGPLLGSVLAGSLKDGPVPITMAMLGFGVGLGLPFALFAAFPSILKKLPQSGGWLNTVKVVLGFVELGLALKFASNADFVYRSGFVLRETFFLVWIVLAIATALYLFGFFKFPHDSPNQKISKARWIIGAIFLAFGIYLIPGVLPKESQPWKTTLISGFPPSEWYSWYAKDVEPIPGIKLDIKDDALRSEADAISELDELLDFVIANNNEGETKVHYHITDYDVGKRLAEKWNKPIFIDFTGYACVNCRKMEEQVWIEDIVQQPLEQYVIISLYVDDKVELPKEDQGVIPQKLADGTIKNKKIVTYGNKWSTFEAQKFGNVSQPWYVLLSPDEYLLNPPVGYTPNPEEYANWLKCGLDAMEVLKTGGYEERDVREEVIIEQKGKFDWKFDYQKKGENSYEMSAIGHSLEEGWHTYSQFGSMDGPWPTTFNFEPSDSYEVVEVREEGTHTYYDDVFGVDVIEFEHEAKFFPQIKRLKPGTIVVKGTIDYQTCIDGACTMQDPQPFEITIND